MRFCTRPGDGVERRRAASTCRDRFVVITAARSNDVDRGLLMYEAYYGLREKPFSILPDPDLIYWGQMHRMAFGMLEFGVMNNAGFTVITGDVGSGKTIPERHLLKKNDPKKINA